MIIYGINTINTFIIVFLFNPYFLKNIISSGISTIFISPMGGIHANVNAPNNTPIAAKKIALFNELSPLVNLFWKIL